MTVAIIAFVLSLLGIAALFSVKYRETKTGRTYFPAFRDASDEKALALKSSIMHARAQIERLPPIMLVMTRYFIHAIALRFAAFLKYGEDQAHRLADMVSHKHRFERRETRSEFLRQVSDHKNGSAERDAAIVGTDEIVG